MNGIDVAKICVSSVACTWHARVMPLFQRGSLKVALSLEFEALLPLIAALASAVLNAVVVGMVYSSSILSACASPSVWSSLVNV